MTYSPRTVAGARLQMGKIHEALFNLHNRLVLRRDAEPAVAALIGALIENAQALGEALSDEKRRESVTTPDGHTQEVARRQGMN